MPYILIFDGFRNSNPCAEVLSSPVAVYHFLRAWAENYDKDTLNGSYATRTEIYTIATDWLNNTYYQEIKKCFLVQCADTIIYIHPMRENSVHECVKIYAALPKPKLVEKMAVSGTVTAKRT